MSNLDQVPPSGAPTSHVPATDDLFEDGPPPSDQVSGRRPGVKGKHDELFALVANLPHGKRLWTGRLKQGFYPNEVRVLRQTLSTRKERDALAYSAVSINVDQKTVVTDENGQPLPERPGTNGQLYPPRYVFFYRAPLPVAPQPQVEPTPVEARHVTSDRSDFVADRDTTQPEVMEPELADQD